MELFELIQALTAPFGPSGQEQAIAQTIAQLARPYADEISTDPMGNLIVHKKGSGAKVLFAAHMDSIGFMVTHIEDSGLVRVGKIGGIRPGNVIGTPVRFKNGTLGAVFEDEELGDKKREIGHLYIDIGAENGEEARKRVQIGDMAVYNTPTFQTGHAVMSPYLDNRICCAALLKTLELCGHCPNDLYFVFTVQEEVGLRGAGPAAFAIDPDYCVVTDVTHCAGLPGAKFGSSAKCGGGAAVKVMDSSVICNPKMVEKLKELGEKNNIPYQLDVITAGGTDAGAIHKSRGGVVTGGVSVPTRHTHCPQEVAWLSDVDAAAKLMAAFCREELPRWTEVSPWQ